MLEPRLQTFAIWAGQPKRGAKDSSISALAAKAKRIRGGVKAEFGDDANEYENVGGKRASDRKKPAAKSPLPA